MISRFYKRYDALQEPWRFLTAMGLIMTGIVALDFGSPTVKIGAAIYLVSLLVTRMWYVKGKPNASA